MKKGTCKHYNGKVFLSKANCDKDINVRELVGGEARGWFKRCPCMKRNESRIPCESYEDPTDDEIEAVEKEWDDLLKRLTTAMPIAEKLKRENPNGGSGIAECPTCKGKFHYKISSYNGHMHAKCETDNCLSFME